jgi:hypothetical protein
MKKLFYLIALLCASIQLFAQSPADSTKTKLRPYVSVGVSMGNVDPNNPNTDSFDKASYPSFEAGVMGKNISLGAVFGCENFFVSPSSRGFYEVKTSLSKSFGNISPYALFGVGAYFEKDFNNFIEYGAGFSYMPNKLGYFVQYSNWAATNYVSCGFTYGF